MLGLASLAHQVPPDKSVAQTEVKLTATSPNSLESSTKPGLSSVHPNCGKCEAGEVLAQESAPQHQRSPVTSPQASVLLAESPSTRNVSPVDSKSACAPFTVLARTLFKPDVAPSVHTALAYPSPSVVSAAGSMLPPPCRTAQVTVTPDRGAPDGSTARTTSVSINSHPGAPTVEGAWTMTNSAGPGSVGWSLQASANTPTAQTRNGIVS